MKVKNIDGLTKEQLKQLVSQGGKFVMFGYTVSVIVMTFKKGSDVYFIKPGESTAKYHAPFTLLTLVMGWWGVPWGPIYSLGSLAKNIGGGTDVTSEVASQLGLHDHEGYNIPGSNSTASSQSGGYNIPGSSGTNSNQSGGYNIPR